MQLNPIKTINNWVLTFLRYFYDENFQYTNNLFKSWFNKLIPFILTIAFTGFVGWLFALSLISLFQVTWIKLDSGILNIFQIGLIIWCSEKTYEFIRRYKK